MPGSVLQKIYRLELDSLAKEGGKEVFINTLVHLHESGIYNLELVQNNEASDSAFNHIPSWLADPQIKAILKDFKLEKHKYILYLNETHGPVLEILPEIMRLADENVVYQGLIGFIHLVDEYSQSSTSIDAMRELTQASAKNDEMSKQLLKLLSASDLSAPPPSVETIKQHLLKQMEGVYAGEAFFRLALISLLKQGNEQDNEEAIKWLNESVLYCHPLAQLLLAKIYADGKIVPKNDLLASVYYEVSAQQDILMAQTAIADRYAEGLGVEKSDKKAIDWRKKAAENGDAMSFYIIGDAYEFGFGVDKSLEFAYEFFMKAAQSGVIDAKARAAFVLLNTAKLNVLYIIRAVNLLNEAVSQNSPVGLFLMGTYLHSGLLNPYIKPDPSRSLELVGKSARLGYQPAQKLIYSMNLDVGLAPGELEGWIQKLAKEGDPHALEWCKKGPCARAPIANSQQRTKNSGQNYLPTFARKSEEFVNTVNFMNDGVAALNIEDKHQQNGKVKGQNKRK